MVEHGRNIDSFGQTETCILGTSQKIKAERTIHPGRPMSNPARKKLLSSKPHYSIKTKALSSYKQHQLNTPLSIQLVKKNTSFTLQCRLRSHFKAKLQPMTITQLSPFIHFFFFLVSFYITSGLRCFTQWNTTTAMFEPSRSIMEADLQHRIYCKKPSTKDMHY